MNYDVFECFVIITSGNNGGLWWITVVCYGGSLLEWWLKFVGGGYLRLLVMGDPPEFDRWL